MRSLISCTTCSHMATTSKLAMHARRYYIQFYHIVTCTVWYGQLFDDKPVPRANLFPTSLIISDARVISYYRALVQQQRILSNCTNVLCTNRIEGGGGSISRHRLQPLVRDLRAATEMERGQPRTRLCRHPYPFVLSSVTSL